MGDGFYDYDYGLDALKSRKHKLKKIAQLAKDSAYDEFYILWEPGSDLPPRVRMETREKAVEVAEKMARQHGKRFYIMKAVALAEPTVAPIAVRDIEMPTPKPRKAGKIKKAKR